MNLASQGQGKNGNKGNRKIENLKSSNLQLDLKQAIFDSVNSKKINKFVSFPL